MNAFFRLGKTNTLFCVKKAPVAIKDEINHKSQQALLQP
jgi:hypothetical protein